MAGGESAGLSAPDHLHPGRRIRIIAPGRRMARHRRTRSAPELGRVERDPAAPARCGRPRRRSAVPLGGVLMSAVASARISAHPAPLGGEKGVRPVCPAMRLCMYMHNGTGPECMYMQSTAPACQRATASDLRDLTTLATDLVPLCCHPLPEGAPFPGGHASSAPSLAAQF